MDVVWDSRKAAANVQKHGVSFDEAATALRDPFAITVVDDVQDEFREVSVGTSAVGRLLLVVHIQRSENEIRIISARKATPKERREYEEGI